MDSHYICRTDDIAEGEARGFTLTAVEQAIPSASEQHEPQETRLIVIKLGQRFHVYQNSCPHTGVNLNWMPDRFFDIDKQYLQCAMHGALFRPQDGYCVRGPCAGQSLQAYETEIIDHALYLKTARE